MSIPGSNPAPPPAKRSWEETHQLMHGPGAPLEIHNVVVNSRVHKAYKGAPPNMRAFFLYAATTFAAAPYLILDEERYTYAETLALASRAASVFREAYGVKKGDKVAIVMRNYPQWVITYWACYLLGAVPVCVNAFVPGHVIAHCITLTSCKLIVLDAERAARLHSHIAEVKRKSGATGALAVIKKKWDSEKVIKGALRGGDVRDWDEVMADKKWEKAIKEEVWKKEPECTPGDDGSVFFTSGTTGLPKGVLAHQLANITAAYQGILQVVRATLRKGEIFDFTAPPPVQKAALLCVPLFHVTGCQAVLLGQTLVGGKVVMMRKWDVDEGVELIMREKITSAGGVPSIALDLLDSEKFLKTKNWLENISYGGAPAPATIAAGVAKLPEGQIAGSKGVNNGQGYGLTETSAGIANILGIDSTHRPLAAGYPLPTTDILIIDSKTRTECPVGEIGEIWIHGPQVMNGYYNNPAATKKVLTKDGWFNSEDLGYVDKEGFLYLKGRVKDIIIRGGENIDATSVENAFYDDGRVLSCAVVGVPDSRLGELPVAFVVPAHNTELDEKDIIARVRSHLPAFAVPVMAIVQHEPLPTNAAGKILKTDLRGVAKAAWEKRKKSSKKHGVKAKL